MGPLIGVPGENRPPENPGVSFCRCGCAQKRQKEEGERAEKKLAKEHKALTAQGEAQGTRRAAAQGTGSSIAGDFQAWWGNAGGGPPITEPFCAIVVSESEIVIAEISQKAEEEAGVESRALRRRSPI